MRLTIGARARRTIGIVAGALLAFAVLFPIAYAAFVPEHRAPLPASWRSLQEPPPGRYLVYVADWGYHTAIILQQPPGWRFGPPGDESAPFLEYAWGDRRYYLESDFWPQSVYATLALPTASVLYLSGHPDPPLLSGTRGLFVRTVDAATLRALVLALERSVQHDASGARVAAYPPTPEYPGRFYPAYGAYLWTRACNWWTVARLHEAGLADDPAGVILSAQVSHRLRGFTRATQRVP